jgi:hypothetical protein
MWNRTSFRWNEKRVLMSFSHNIILMCKKFLHFSVKDFQTFNANGIWNYYILTPVFALKFSFIFINNSSKSLLTKKENSFTFLMTLIYIAAAFSPTKNLIKTLIHTKKCASQFKHFESGKKEVINTLQYAHFI